MNGDALNTESFLFKMGYSVNTEDNRRKAILDAAIKQYGIRKVSDHLSFLIITRQRQQDGITKYAHAITVWQSDLNYINRRNS